MPDRLFYDFMSERQKVVTRKDTLPQAVGFPYGRLPQSERAVLGAAGVQLAIWTEANTVHWTEVTLIGLCRQGVTRGCDCCYGFSQ